MINGVTPIAINWPAKRPIATQPRPTSILTFKPVILPEASVARIFIILPFA